MHDKNSDRVEAVVQKKVVDVFSADCEGYLSKMLEDLLMNMLRAEESTIMQGFLNQASDMKATLFLKAPDVFIAAVMLKQDPTFFGKGDF